MTRFWYGFAPHGKTALQPLNSVPKSRHFIYVTKLPSLQVFGTHTSAVVYEIYTTAVKRLETIFAGVAVPTASNCNPIFLKTRGVSFGDISPIVYITI
jgi:hypothetical protein